MNANATSSRKITELPTARRWRRNRRTDCWNWLRSRTVNSRSTLPGWTPVVCGAEVVGVAVLDGSGMADPRVQDAVQQVGDQVEHDDDGGRDQQPPHGQVHVA